MRINIKASNLELTSALKTYVEEKMNMLEKYMGNIVKAINFDFEIEKSVGGQNKGEIFRAEANLQVPGNMLRVEKTERDMYKAIDKVKDHMELVIKKHKEKIEDKRRRKI
jgi:putative sigma-54 modulation protein